MTDWMVEGWPVKDDGEPDDEVLLGNENDLASGAGVCTSFLESCGVPYLTRYPAAGQVGHIYGGVSPVGVDIYVPASLLEYAQEVLYGAEVPACDDDYEEVLL